MSKQLAGVDVSKKDTTAKYALLSETRVGGTTYCYVQANGASAIGGVGLFSSTGQFTPLTTTAVGAVPSRIGVAQTAFADDEYGWVAVEGTMNVLAAASCASGAKLYTTATAGVVDDNASSTTLVAGLRLLETVGGSQALATAFATTRLTIN